MEILQRVKKVIKWLIYMEYAENQDELAQHLGYSKSSFSQLVNGKVPLSGKFIGKLCQLDSNINKNWILTGKEAMFNIGAEVTLQKNFQGVPLIPIEDLPNINIDIKNKKEFPMYVIPEFDQKGVEFAVRVSDISMYPKFSPGDILACKPIPIITFFQWGKVYVLETTQGVLIKKVHRASIEDNILCVSENKDEYPSFELPRAEIISCSIVLGLIHFE